MFHADTGSLLKGARALAFAAAAAVTAIGTAHADGITGAGSSFAAPIYTRWAEQYAAQGGVKLNYQSVGSGAGQTQVINRTVDFGASDAAVAADRLAANNLLQFPTCVGGVVVVVNLPGVDGSKLKLNGGIVADMYLGKIRMWNDKRIAALNPGVKLPPLPVAAAYRADASGTTSIFTDYLGRLSPAFKSAIGVGTSVAWKSGAGAPGNAGVAGAVTNIKGGIGYVEYAYATENHMPAVMLQNKSGKFVPPTAASFAAAAANADYTADPNMAVNLNNTEGDGNWPIVGATYVLFPTNPTDAARAASAVKFFEWAFKNGQPAADQLHYILLPRKVQDLIVKRWSQVQVNGKPVYTPAK
jgi:phosphate transport system substrate-binding protein